MKKKQGQFISLFLALLLVMTMAGAVPKESYAWDIDGPELYDFCGDMWIRPGESAIAWIQADPGFSEVYLRVYENGKYVRQYPAYAPMMKAITGILFLQRVLMMTARRGNTTSN